MIPPPPTSTLFPYTTLFRSHTRTHRAHIVQVTYDPSLVKYEDLLRIFWNSKRDRKSTRLNSSHVEISYAVFCLKKKTNTYAPCRLVSSTARHVAGLHFIVTV